MTLISVSPACTMPEEATAWDHSLRNSLVRKTVSCGRFAVSWVVCTVDISSLMLARHSHRRPARL
ncbi:MAG: hypothetical protein UEP80_00570, partial [Senegalimassilia anaerobia]|nr:hypothetical protein [Senegalimassilia anaerobia]